MKKVGRTFVTGDIHSTYSIDKLKKSNWKEGQTLSKRDILIIAGDFGLLWNNIRTKHEAYWLKWLDDQPWTTCFVDGNHENHDLLDNLQRGFICGAEVGIVAHSIYHLLRGNVYKINDKRILAFGGAHSHDREHRKWGESMWKQEEITEKDLDNAYHNLAIYHNKVDYVITHCAPSDFAKAAIPLSYAPFWSPDHSEEFLQILLPEIVFKTWFFGHYHDDCYDTVRNRWVCCFDKIHELE